MKILILNLIVLGYLVLPSFGATVTCEVKAVDGATIILGNCDEKRTKDFQPGNKVKVKLDKKVNEKD